MSVPTLQSSGFGTAVGCTLRDGGSALNGIAVNSRDAALVDCQIIGHYAISSSGGVGITHKAFGCRSTGSVLVGTLANLVWVGGEIGSAGSATLSVSGSSSSLVVAAAVYANVDILASSAGNCIVNNTGTTGGNVAVSATVPSVVITGEWASVTFSGVAAALRRFDGSSDHMDFTGPGQVKTVNKSSSFGNKVILRGSFVDAHVSMKVGIGLQAIGLIDSYLQCDFSAAGQSYSFDAACSRIVAVLTGTNQAGFGAKTNVGNKVRIITEDADSLLTSIVNSGVLNGPPGQDGEPGADGDPGEPGSPGAPGAAGATGATGATGSSGAPGAPGAQGPGGPPGEDGEPGADGAPGVKGDKGDTGATGATGPAGSGGGSTGAPGVDGEEGEQGPPGNDGKDALPNIKYNDGTYTYSIEASALQGGVAGRLRLKVINNSTLATSFLNIDPTSNGVNLTSANSVAINGVGIALSSTSAGPITINSASNSPTGIDIIQSGQGRLSIRNTGGFAGVCIESNGTAVTIRDVSNGTITLSTSTNGQIQISTLTPKMFKLQNVIIEPTGGKLNSVLMQGTDGSFTPVQIEQLKTLVQGMVPPGEDGEDGADGMQGEPGSTLLDVQTFTASGTWKKPAGARVVRVQMWGGGAGGGAGGGSTGAVVRYGGAGGGGGGYAEQIFRASDLALTETVTVGVGGAGGTPGIAGAVGGDGVGGSPGDTTFGTTVLAGVGGGGAGKGGAVTSGNGGGGGGGGIGYGGGQTGGIGGTTAAAATPGGPTSSTANAINLSGTDGGGGTPPGTANGIGSLRGGGGGGSHDTTPTTVGKGGSSLYGGGGGGVGGSATAVPALVAGTAGGGNTSYLAANSGTGGAVGANGVSPGVGTPGADGTGVHGGAGGGGGGASITANTSGAVGGAGGVRGGGGGGGGAGSNTGVGGAGGNGGRGEVIVTSW